VGPATGGLWSTSGDWSHGVPTASTNVCIDNGNRQHSAVTLNIAGAQADNLTIDGDDSLSFNNGASLTVNGNTLRNAGSLSLNSTGNSTDLIIASPNVTLSGGGTVTLSNNVNNYIFGSATTDTLTNQETISGAGQIGHGEMTLVNSGTINANQSSGMTVYANGGTTNTGTMEATAGSTLLLYGMTVANAGGTISATGSRLQLSGATVNGGTVTLTGASLLQLTNGTVQGGTLNNSSTGTIEAVSGTSTLGGTVNNPAGGVLKIDNGAFLNLETGTYSNLGTVTLNSTGNSSALVIDGSNVTLSGGTVTLSNNPNNYIFGAANTDTLTNQETISGAGQIGHGEMTLVNTGTINANQSSGIIIQTSGNFTNSGTLQVSSGDTMHVSGGPFTNFSGKTLTGGSYVVAGTLEIDELGKTGGEIVTDAAKISLNGAAAKFIDAAGKDVTTNIATITSTGAFGITGRTFTTTGNFTNDGALTIGGGSKFIVNGNLINFSGTTLTGGTFAVTGTLQFNGANIVNNASNIMLTGTASKIVNQSQADALANLANNEAPGSFTLAGGRSFTTVGNFTDAGTFHVSKGSTFSVAANNTYAQTGGTTTVDGTLAVSGSGKVNINTGSVFGNGGTFSGSVVSGGKFNIGDALKKAGQLAITGTYKQSSTGILPVDIGGLTAGTLYDQLNIKGSAILGGTLNLDLINGFTPTIGSMFDIMNFSSETGDFATVNGLQINQNEHFQKVVHATNVMLIVVKGPVSSGPIFGDGQASLGPLNPAGNAGLGNTAGVSAAPEPSTLLLVGSGLLGGVMSYRRRRRIS
jgi:hypothetical protein